MPKCMHFKLDTTGTWFSKIFNNQYLFVSVKELKKKLMKKLRINKILPVIYSSPENRQGFIITFQELNSIFHIQNNLSLHSLLVLWYSND